MGLMDELVADATGKLEHLEAALHSLGTLRERVSSPDGTVTAEVDGNGALTDLELTEAITTVPAKDVGPLIVATCHRAAAAAGARRAQVIAELNRAFRGEEGGPPGSETAAAPRGQ